MNKFLFLLSILTVGFLSAQKQLHIKYLNVRSPIANVYENLYTDGKKVISKQDGNMMIANSDFATKKKGRDFYFMSTIAEGKRDFFFTTYIEGRDDYFVYDEVPKIEWIIEKETTKKILGYDCRKATAIFRGSSITAYFTKEIPYSVGPFKFFGLPGAILDVRADNKDYDLWKAVEVNLDDKTNVDYLPEFPSLKKIKMKDFVEMEDKAYQVSGDNIKVPGSTGKVVNVRLQVEKVFEWETIQ